MTLTGLRDLTGAQRFLLASAFLATLGCFAVLPFMSVLLHQRLGLGMGVVGAVLAVASFVQFAGCVVGAAVAEQLGLQRTLLLAMVLDLAGFAAFVAGVHWAPAMIGGLVLVCCGAALYLPAAKAYLVHGADARRRPLLLSASNSALNSGVALGPLAAGPFVLDASGALFGAVFVLFAGLAVGHALLPAADPVCVAEVRDPPWRVLAGIPVLPFAVTVLTFYLHMFFYYYLPVFTVPRVSAVFYGVVLMLHSLLLVVLQPLFAARIGRLGYPLAVLAGFTAMGAGMAVLALGSAAAILAGAVLICLGEVVLFLKNDLEAIARSRRSAAVVFGQQRLAAGIGAFASGLLGGVGYGALDQAGRAPLFWLAVAAQCAVLPLLLLAARRAGRRPAGRTPVPQPASDDTVRTT